MLIQLGSWDILFSLYQLTDKFAFYLDLSHVSTCKDAHYFYWSKMRAVFVSSISVSARRHLLLIVG